MGRRENREVPILGLPRQTSVRQRRSLVSSSTAVRNALLAKIAITPALAPRRISNDRSWCTGASTFFSRYNNLTCVAAPIFTPDGELTGILDASSDCMSRQAHTQALVAMAATQIENGLFREHHRGNLLIAFHNRGEYLHTLSAGLLAVDNEGRILAANRTAGILLHGLPASPGRRFADVFRTKFSTFVDEDRRKERQRLEDDVGSQFVSTIENTRQFPMIQGVSRPRPPPPKEVVRQFVSLDPTIAGVSSDLTSCFASTRWR